MTKSFPDDIATSFFPPDAFNQELLDNVHPVGHKNPKPKGIYNLVVIGGGTAGLVCAAGAAGLGAKVALIERQFMGGDCLNFGCVPSKAILKSAHALKNFKKASILGIDGIDALRVDFGRMMSEMRKIRARISHHDSVARFKNLGVDVFLGHAEFKSDNTIAVDEHHLTFKKAVIATGARPRKLEVEGAEHVPLLTNETVFSLTTLPKKLVVVGAGPIGCEIGQAFSAFGSDVVIVEVSDKILMKDDQEAAKLVLSELSREGIHFLFSTQPTKLTQQNTKKELHILQRNQCSILSADEIFCSLGRIANIEGLGLKKASIAHHSSGVVVNNYLQTTNKNVFAAGDVCSKNQFTHAADAMARIVIQNALFFGKKKVSDLVIPWCTYTNPELASVGLSEDAARARGIQAGTIIIPMTRSDRALLDRDEQGFLKVVYDRKDGGRIVGACVVNKNAGDMINTWAIAISNKLKLSDMGKAIYCYPTKTEVMKRAADDYNKTRLKPYLTSVLKQYMGFRRI